MVAKGSNIEDFEAPREKRPNEVLPQNLEPEALISEHLVNLVLTKAQIGDPNYDIISSLKPILKEKGLPFPENLTQASMDEIWMSFTQLCTLWQQLPNGEILELEFSLG